MSKGEIKAGDLHVACTCTDKNWQSLKADLVRHAQVIWHKLQFPPAELSLCLTDDTGIAALNRAFRGKRGATNVLAFPGQDFLRPVETADFIDTCQKIPLLLGDVVLAYGTLAFEAAQSGRALKAHARYLLTHGMLHLLGYDHQTRQQASAMEKMENHLLTAGGRGG